MVPRSTVRYNQPCRIETANRCYLKATSEKKKDNKKQSKKAKRSVSFFSSVMVKRTIHINDYTDAEIDACFYSCDEAKEFRQEARQTAKMLEDGLFEADTETQCIRGTECRTRENTKRRQQLRLASSFAVFDEQDEQYENKIVDPEAIADSYRAACGPAMSAARAKALRDEMAVAMMTTQ